MQLSLTEAIPRCRACLLGGAVGDALGAAVEFNSLATIQARFGAAGVTDLEEAYGARGAVTDDTQMTLFTAEGLLRAKARSEARGFCHAPSVLHHAYLRWLFTQGERPIASITLSSRWPDGLLIEDRRLFSRRGPGNTCLTALRAVKELGARATNDSKGCGTVMRVAPIGLALAPASAYQLAEESSALTHGHPTGFIAGGAFAMLISHVLTGRSLLSAAQEVRSFIAAQERAEETTRAIDRALTLACEGSAPGPAQVESLGGGWVAEEALAIALYAALSARSFEHGVLLAVNHSGDSDSTGSMAGQLLGLSLGLAAIPSRWLRQVELGDLIVTLADDLARLRAGCFRPRPAYPGS